MDERVKKWLKEHDGDEYCNYCKYKLICGGKIIPGPNGQFMLHVQMGMISLT